MLDRGVDLFDRGVDMLYSCASKADRGVDLFDRGVNMLHSGVNMLDRGLGVLYEIRIEKPLIRNRPVGWAPPTFHLPLLSEI